MGLSNGSVFCVFKDEEYEAPVTNMICTDPDSYNAIEIYVDSIELRLEKCLRNPKKCQ